MGFCLFEENDGAGLYLAVNAGHVDFVTQEDGFTRLSFAHDQQVDVAEPVDAVRALLLEAAKIGVNKLSVNVMARMDSAQLAPLLLHHAQRIMIVREIPAHDLSPDRPAEVMVMSTVVYEDGRAQFITERPGVFVMRANAGGVVLGV